MSKLVIIGPSLKMGGMENASVNLANSMTQHYDKVVFIAFFNQDHFFNLDRKIEFIEPQGFNSFKLNLFKTLFWLRECVRKTDPDQIIVFNKFYSALTLLSLLGLNQKVLLSERSSPLFRWPLKQALICKLVFSILKPSGIIAQTNIASKYQQAYYGKKVPIRVIPNTLRKVNLYPELERKNTILAVGRLNDKLKGFDQLLLAYAKIQPTSWELHIAGGTLEEDKLLHDIVREKKLFGKVKFLGKVLDIDKEYAKAGIFVIPSRSEGFPNALCEAMAAGLPCISFDFIAGPSEIIVDGVNGILVENGNIIKLSKAINYLIENDSKRYSLGEKAKNITAKLDQEKISQTIISFIQDV